MAQNETSTAPDAASHFDGRTWTWDDNHFVDAVLHELQEGVTVHDAAGELLFANARARQLLRIRNGNQLFAGIRVLDEERRSFSRKELPFLKAARENRNVVMDLCLARTHRPRMWLRVTCTPLHGAASERHVVCSWSDVTDLRETQERLMFQTAVMEAQREASPAGIVVLSAHGRVSYWNRRFLKMWGVQEALLLSGSSRVLFERLRERVNRPAALEEITLALRFNPTAVLRDIELDFVDGRRVECHSSPLRMSQAYSGRVWFFRNVTRRKKREALEREFLAMAAHELRNPLNAILLSAGALARSLGDPAKAPEPQWSADKAELVVRQARRLDRLIGRILDVALLHGAVPALEVEEVDVLALARELVEAHQTEAARAGSPLVVGGEPLRCPLDRSRIEQVVENLVSNALKYGEGTAVSVTVCQQGDEVRITVADQGPGIPPEHQARIFEAFHRASDKEGGVGLGLYVAKRVVDAHGGRIELVTAQGQGCAFTVVLPAAGPGVAQPLPAEPTAS